MLGKTLRHFFFATVPICVYLWLDNLAMLTTLRIKNLALVSDLTLELQPGCNVITGETGAGKSIIIGALNLVLGERADRTLIRSGEESCSVEAVFDVRETPRAAEKLSWKKTAWSRARTISLC